MEAQECRLHGVAFTLMKSLKLTFLRQSKTKAGLQASGQPAVLQQTLYAIVGAVALQKGAIVANDFVRERILSQLGLR